MIRRNAKCVYDLPKYMKLLSNEGMKRIEKGRILDLRF